MLYSSICLSETLFDLILSTDWEVVSVSIKILKSKVAQAFNEKDAAVLTHCLCLVLRKKLRYGKRCLNGFIN